MIGQPSDSQPGRIYRFKSLRLAGGVKSVEGNGELLLIDPEETVLKVNETGAQVLTALLAGQGEEMAVRCVIDQTGCEWAEAEAAIDQLITGLASRGFLNLEPCRSQN
jgi:hypothetical protein